METKKSPAGRAPAPPGSTSAEVSDVTQTLTNRDPRSMRGGPSSIEPALGQRLGGTDGGRFELLERLGGGGMAVVFLALDTILERTVAIKFLSDEELTTTEALERIHYEAQACARLNHENIVQLFDMGRDNGQPFLVMEYLEGRALDAVLRGAGEPGLDPRRAVRMLIDVTRGLSHAHRAGIVHRDLKPSNVFIVKNGTAKILDFGVAQMMASPSGRYDLFSGTPKYMSPEQWRSEAQDGRTDVWAVGVMLFELLTGVPPFPSENLAELRDAISSSDPAPPLRSVRPDLPEEAERVAGRALKKNIGERFASADALLDALIGLEVALADRMRSRYEVPRTEPRPERRQLTVLSCSLHEDLRTHAFDELEDVLDDFFEVCTTVVRQLEGTLLSSLGSRFIACFGYPIAREDNAQRAIRAAFLIVDAVLGRAYSRGSRTARLGIGTGLSIANRAPGNAGALTLRGDAIDEAQWLEQQAGAYEVLVDPLTRTLAKSAFEFEPLGDGTSPRGHRVVRPRESATRFDPDARRVMTPFVGRESELGALDSVWNSIRRGEPRFVSIVGEAGVGKSRLLNEHLQRLAGESHDVIQCQCWPQFQNSALQPVVEGLFGKLGIWHADSPAVRLQRLETVLFELGLALAEHVPLLGTFFGVSSDRYPAPDSNRDVLKKSRLQAMVNVVLHMARRQPLIVIVEDAHWSDASTLELLELLLRTMADTRLLVIVTGRPEFQPAWPEFPHLERVALGRLPPDRTAAMISLASQGRELPLAVSQQLAERTDGVPLFVEELTHMVAESLGHGATAGDSFVSSGIPATLEVLLRARLDALPQESQDLACLIAVLGREATRDLIVKTLEVPAWSLRARLAQLVDANILRLRGEGPETRYIFKHALVRDAAYQSLVRSRRALLHRRVAQTLRTHFSELVERCPELVAEHLIEAGCPDEAVGYCEKAAEVAIFRSASVDAATHYRLALEQLAMLEEGPRRDRRELSLTLALGMVLFGMYWFGSPEVHRTYERVRELAERVGGYHEQPFASLLGLWRYEQRAANLAAAKSLAQQIMIQGERTGDATTRMFAHSALGMNAVLSGNSVACLEHAASVLSIYDPGEHARVARRIGIDPSVHASTYRMWALGLMGRWDEALADVRDAVVRAVRTRHPFSHALALISVALCHNQRGEYEEGRRVADEVGPLCLEHGFGALMSLVHLVRGWSRMAMGDHGGMDEVVKGASGRRNDGSVSAFTLCLVVLAWAQWRTGALDDAMCTLDEGEAFVEAKGEHAFEAELLRLRAEVLLAKDPTDVERASEYLDRGFAVAGAQRAKAWELRLAVTRARLLQRLARPAEARAVLEPALVPLRAYGPTGDVREAEILLAELS